MANVNPSLFQLPSSTQCVNEIFYFNREGSELLSGSEYFCGDGLVERTSFLNRAVFSYISTPPNKRFLENELKDTEEDMKTRITTTTTSSTTTTTTTTTKKPHKAKRRRTTTQAPKTPNKSTLLEMTSTMMTSSTAPSMGDKNVSNSFAYVVALLSNKLDTLTFTDPDSNTSSAMGDVAGPPTGVFSYYDRLPASTWRNASLAIHKISSKRASKVIVGQDYTSSSTSPPWPHERSDEVGGGGWFSCLVEVVQPSCECGWGSTTRIVGGSGVAGVNEFPSMAGVISTKTQRIFCGAAISEYLEFSLSLFSGHS